MKKLALVIIFVIAVFGVQNVFAHPNLQSSYIDWGESIGWSIDEGNHTNSTTLTYKFDSADTSLTDSIKNTVRSGASKWSSYGTVSESSSGVGTITTYSDSSTSTTSSFADYSSNSSGHLTTWKIKINRYYTVMAVTLAHEFGHAYGLNDLYDSSNYSKLMCGYRDERTATVPTTSDGKGFKVITGVHTHTSSTTWSYKQISGVPLSVPIHMKYCGTCDGYKTESCSPITGKCTKCGYTH